MAIDALQIWKDTLENLPKVADNSWAANFAAWYGDRLAGITTAPASLIPSGFAFAFAESIFAAQLISLTPVGDALSGISGFAAAWETALLATTVAVAPGTVIPPASPPTTFSAIVTTIIDPASIAAGKAKILELVAAPPVANAQDSQFPIKFRAATLLLTITVQGLDSNPDGPEPLTAPAVPLI